MIDLPPPPELWLPPKPAIIRPAPEIPGPPQAVWPFGSPAAVPLEKTGPKLTFVAALPSADNNTQYTWSAVPFPTGGLAICAALGHAISGTNYLDVLRIGGVNTTVRLSGTDETWVGLTSLRVAEGEHDIYMRVVGGSGSGRVCVFVWLLTENEADTPTDVSWNSANSGGSRNVFLDIEKKGVAVYGAYHFNAAGTTFSSATKLWDQDVDGGPQFAAAQRVSPAAVTDYEETATWSSAHYCSIVGGSWR